MSDWPFLFDFARRRSSETLGVTRLSWAGIFAGFALLASCNEGDKVENTGSHSKRQDAPTKATAGHRGGRITNVDQRLLAAVRLPITSDGERKILLATIGSLSDEALQSLLQTLDQTRNTARDKEAFSAAIAELARRDPGGALSWFEPGKMTRLEAGWGPAAVIIAESDPGLLEKWLLEDLPNGSPEVQSAFLRSGIQALQKGAGYDHAIEFYAKVDKKLLPPSELINAVFLNYGMESPAEAEKAAVRLFKGAELDMALHAMAFGMAARDPEKAVAMVSRISDTSARNFSLATQYKNWLESDPSTVMDRLGKLDPGDVAGILRSDPFVPGQDGLVAKLAKVDPDALIRIMGSMVVSSSNQEVFKQAVTSLSLKNPEKAWGLIEGLPEGGMKNNLYGDYFSRIARSEPSTAIQGASAMPAGDARSGVYRTIGNTVGGKGFEETLRLVQSVPEGERSSFMAGAMPYLANEDPQKALTLLGDKTLQLGKDVREATLARVGNQFYRSDPSSAEQWLKDLPAEDQSSAMRGVAGEMAKSDVQGLAKMLSSFPRNETWANGVRILVEDLQHSDPELAKEWQNELKTAGF